MTLIELTVVILVLLSLVSVLFIASQAWKRGADRSGCIMNIRNIQQAVRSHQNFNQLTAGASLNVTANLIGTDNFLQVEPACPGGGTYTYASTVPEIGTLAVECSLGSSEDHAPPASAGW